MLRLPGEPGRYQQSATMPTHLLQTLFGGNRVHQERTEMSRMQDFGEHSGGRAADQHSVDQAAGRNEDGPSWSRWGICGTQSWFSEPDEFQIRGWTVVFCSSQSSISVQGSFPL